MIFKVQLANMKAIQYQHQNQILMILCLSPSDLGTLMASLSIKCDFTVFEKMVDSSSSEKQLLVFTGLTWEKIIQLRHMMTSMREN